MVPRSYMTQRMQNYLDYSDVRSRESPVSLESQLLNLAGFEIEDLIQRVGRETTQSLQSTPVNIDNLGVYYSSQLPSSLQPAQGVTTFSNIVGLLGDKQITLNPYTDTLPIPSRVEIDVPNIVPFPTPLMFEITGAGYSSNGPIQNYAVQYVQPGTFPIPNKLTLWVDKIGFNLVQITLTITGNVFPTSPWVSDQKTTTEVLTITQEGAAITRNRWSSISQIVIHNLPVNMRLRGYSMPFNLYSVPDTARPYTAPEHRGQLFPRYWKIDNVDSLLLETYQAGLFTGMETLNSYRLPDIITDVAVEPYTYGMYVCSKDALYYVDRREYQASLLDTGLTVEPLYGLQVSFDFTKKGPVRYAALSAVPYANSGNIVQYRYVLNSTNTILPSGALGPINAGWRAGAPAPVSFPMIFFTDYQFELQMQDTNGVITTDIVPFRNAILNPLKVIGMQSMIDNIAGMAYDSYGKLWLWNGFFALPLIIHNDSYVYDPDTTTLYVTEPFDSLQVTV